MLASQSVPALPAATGGYVRRWAGEATAEVISRMDELGVVCCFVGGHGDVPEPTPALASKVRGQALRRVAAGSVLDSAVGAHWAWSW